MTRDYVDREAIEAEAARRWPTDPKLREEFRDVKVYQAYLVADAGGRANIHRGKVVDGADVRHSSIAASPQLTDSRQGTRIASGDAPPEVGGSGAGAIPTHSGAFERYQPGGDWYRALTRRALGY